MWASTRCSGEPEAVAQGEVSDTHSCCRVKRVAMFRLYCTQDWEIQHTCLRSVLTTFHPNMDVKPDVEGNVWTRCWVTVLLGLFFSTSVGGHSWTWRIRNDCDFDVTSQ